MAEPDPLVVELTALLVVNAAKRGDTDVLPRARELEVLAAYSQEAANAAWQGQPGAATVEIVEVPLSRYTARDVHLIDPLSFLRFGGTVLSGARAIEHRRCVASVAVHWRPNRSRARLFAPGQFERHAARLALIEATSPLVLELDIALCFPSLTEDVVYAALSGFQPRHADAVRAQLRRLGCRGLPVGGVPSRLLAEAVLQKLDIALVEAGRVHVRGLDDLHVGVRDAHDAENVRRLVARTLRDLDLHLNKGKTRLRIARRPNWSAPLHPARTIREQIALSDPDRPTLSRALYDLRRAIPTWDLRRRRRWLDTLTEALPSVPVCVRGILITLECLARGVDSIDTAQLRPVRELMEGPIALHRAEASRFLSRYDAAVAPRLALAAAADPSALVRREALFGLSRLGARDEVRHLLRGNPGTELDRSAWVVAAGQTGLPLPFAIDSVWLRLLRKAAADFQVSSPGPVLSSRHRCIPAS